MPLLPAIVESLDKVPEGARTFYEQKDGKFNLLIEGVPAGFVAGTVHAEVNSKLGEFRENNVLFLKELETLRPLKAKFEGIDPDAAREALTQVGEFKKKGAAKPDDIAALIQTSITAALKPVQDKLAMAEKQSVENAQRADESTLRSTISEKFLKAGGLPKALDYILNEAKATFKVESGTVIAMPNRFSSLNAGQPLGVDEWLGTAAKEHDFAFKSSQGGGTPPSGSGGGGRPGQLVIRNPTPQQLGDPKNAAALKKGELRFEFDNAAQA